MECVERVALPDYQTGSADHHGVTPPADGVSGSETSSGHPRTGVKLPQRRSAVSDLQRIPPTTASNESGPTGGRVSQGTSAVRDVLRELTHACRQDRLTSTSGNEPYAPDREFDAALHPAAAGEEMIGKSNFLSNVAVRGFKSICDEQRVDLRPLTILAGANSSGKSSIMQPLLLMKQTLEASGDPGALLLDGLNVRFTSKEQLLSKLPAKSCDGSFAIRLTAAETTSLETQFRSVAEQGFDVERMVYRAGSEVVEVVLDMSHEEIVALLPEELKKIASGLSSKQKERPRWRVTRDRCVLSFELSGLGTRDRSMPFWPLGGISPSAEFLPLIQSVIHLPGLRGNPQRTYPKMAAGPQFPGTFEPYVASIVFQWQNDKSDELNELGKSMEELGLSWKVTAKPIDDTRVELRVGRLPHSRRGGAHDMVSIADVGFGVSQSLPVLVALLVARPGQLVYLEQPEIHLHPKAQRRLANNLCRAAQRGVMLVVETHSALLLREVQTLVATGAMPADDVRLHWFERNDEGATVVSTAELDEDGAYGDWPEDFDQTELDAEQAYLDAVERRERQR